MTSQLFLDVIIFIFIGLFTFGIGMELIFKAPDKIRRRQDLSAQKKQSMLTGAIIVGWIVIASGVLSILIFLFNV
ncbi:hypothetical protein B4O97_19055 [Marispirochaeta aestuarii]|uniref:Uncharacterized protein n=1 Tax=Marispirochaeta aestuarii TaxID=1963862 RepID=A0A1Y1RTV1_9SPIO|nr:hypothetical protein [Marispirochaeta aestuarii]ORC27216.1 hypothetical protein B4O97_19055 [Marispirochaeta aestuarii]